MTDQKKETVEAEIAQRRDEGLKRMLRTPPKPHSEIAGKAKRKPTDKKGRRK